MNAPELTDGWRTALLAWASKNDNVQELWLFGSRAEGRSSPDDPISPLVALRACRCAHVTGAHWSFRTVLAHSR